MVVINVDVPEKVAKTFKWTKVVSYKEIISDSFSDEIESNYKFKEKVSLQELNDFLWDCINQKV